jgi:hypothetical protein
LLKELFDPTIFTLATLPIEKIGGNIAKGVGGWRIRRLNQDRATQLAG